MTVASGQAPLYPSEMESPAILVTGPRAVGTSMVAWQVLMDSVASDHCTGYLDLEQLGFLAPDLQSASLVTKLANVATCWKGLRDQGAERLVLCGHLDGRGVTAFRQLMPSLRVVALTAEPDTLLPRAARRRRHKDVWLPGDDLFGCDGDHLRDVVSQAATWQAERADLVVNTDGMMPNEIAARITPLWLEAGTS